MAAGNRPTAENIENRPPTPSGIGKDVFATQRLGELAKPAFLAGDRNDPTGRFAHVISARTAKRVEENPE